MYAERMGLGLSEAVHPPDLENERVVKKSVDGDTKSTLPLTE